MTTEDTQTKELLSDEDNALEAWLHAEKADEPGDSIKEKVIKDSELPAGVGMKITFMESAGWVTVYHRETGDPSIVNRNMLRMQLRKKLDNGNLAFSLVPPKDKDGNIIRPQRGTFKCYLHPDRPEREYFDTIGFPICRKSNITNQHNLNSHMAHRHQAEWGVMKEEKERKEKDEDRSYQRALMEKLANTVAEKPVEAAPLYISDNPPKARKKRTIKVTK